MVIEWFSGKSFFMDATYLWKNIVIFQRSQHIKVSLLIWNFLTKTNFTETLLMYFAIFGQLEAWMAEFDNKFRFAIQKLVYIYTFKENGCHQRSSQTKNQYLRSAIFDSPLVSTRGQIRLFGWQIWISRTEIRYIWPETTIFYLVSIALRLYVCNFLIVQP